ncbi:MAG: hypothetical protein AAFV69_15655, partial [Pseudomonadota bacterium]
MNEQFMTWVAGLDWLQLIVTAHYIGIAVALIGVIIGDSLGARMLLLRGPPISRGAITAAHTLVLVGLFCLLLSGSALLVTKHTWATLPSKLVLKLGLAVLLSINALLLQHFLLPLATRGERPLAANLNVLETLRALAIGITSLTCWVAMTAVAFIPALQALSAMTLYQTYAFMWLVLFTASATATLMLGTVYRSFAPRYPIPGRDRPRAQRTAPLNSFANHQAFAFSQGPSDQNQTHAEMHPPSQVRLSERLVALTNTPPVNDNPHEPAGPRVQLNRHAAQHARHRHEPNVPGRTRHAKSRPENEAAESETHALKDVRAACRRAFLGAAAISFFTNLLMLTGPLFMLQVYDRVLTSKSVATLTALFGLAVALFAFMGLLEAIRSRLLVRIGLRVDRLLSSQVFEAAISVSDPARRDVQAQLLKDLRNVRQFISSAGTTAFFDMPWAPMYFALLFVFHWTLGALALVGAAILIALSILNEWLSRRPVTETAQHANTCEQLFEAGRQGSEIRTEAQSTWAPKAYR